MNAPQPIERAENASTYPARPGNASTRRQRAGNAQILSVERAKLLNAQPRQGRTANAQPERAELTNKTQSGIVSQMKLPKNVREYFAKMGAQGGKIGGKAKGDSKRRGDSEYYRAIRAGKPVKK